MYGSICLFFCFFSIGVLAFQFQHERLCDRLVEVDKSEVNLPVQNGNRFVPWTNFPEVKIYKGNQLNDGWNFIRKLPIRGLNETVDHLLKSLFYENNCGFFVKGGIPRDLVLGIFPNDLDMVATCDVARLKSSCHQRYGREWCIGLFSDRVLHIPDLSTDEKSECSLKGVDIVDWEFTYGENATNLEYTINTFSFLVDRQDSRNDVVYLIALANGLRDLCGRKIRIAAPLQDWHLWAREARKLYRFIKAEVAGFVAVNRQTRDFILDTIVKNFDAHRLDFKIYICQDYLNGLFLNERDLCVYRPLTVERRKKIQKYIEQLKSDFDLNFYQLKLEKAILEMYRVE